MSFITNTINTVFSTLYGPTDTFTWQNEPVYDVYGRALQPGLVKSNLSYGMQLSAKFCIRTLTIGLMILGVYKGMEKNASNVFGQALTLDYAVKLIQKSPVLYVRAGLITSIVLGGISSLIIEKFYS